ncbi:putative transcription factor interactor and regulator CCHC(Zn) family [Helianthus annuus]|uniref:Transcription factor interactor and regulator CCHC(Zn) family n=1 Tax=Helianthus annuus TaxID=4232 RepID=A0A9K3NMY2_HELAN|nr:putative transcription factor interactor and regulator CCHC(Zn) family [Helianthus annuus]KAJ0569638.1 putative transcription factor interactor and regulator CCHC(Zn) family [Helianthus annuus]KAJ0583948.1 putative transcription factor interactor and regulator ARID family [Helianthus annuus]KAJ0918204.1 putative transcription factor interactor and regulator CCHC(Zn) family [Helianthus annuus]KAJ0921978.1 putative transcription factor interactor and regulator CCHC(Zn) family [Helianthus annuu
MLSKPFDDSAASPFRGYQSGIRATGNSDLRANSTVIPCQHHTHNMREQNWIARRCYYCNKRGHKITNCKKKEDDEESQLLRLAINKGTQQQQPKDDDDKQCSGQKSEYLVTGTDGGFWSNMWYVSKSLKHHFSGNLDMFRRIKYMNDVETETGENQFYFIKGMGVVDVNNGIEKTRIQSVFYTQDIDRNVLSYDQLIIQGFTVKFNGDKCKLFPTFSVPIINIRSRISGMTKEEELGHMEKQTLMEKESEFMKYKTNFLNDYFEKLEISSTESDWNLMILQTMKFKDFLDCKALLDMMDDDNYIRKYKFILQTKFDEMVEWFIIEKLGVTTRPIPAYASNNRRIFLLDLYLIVEREGGHRCITENNTWPMIAKEMGFEYAEGELMRLVYTMYLDVLVYYYKFKSVQSNVQDKKVTEEETMLERSANPRGSRSEGDAAIHDADQEGRAGDVQGTVRDTSEHYALFVNNEWSENKRRQARRKFDFNRAKAAMDDANASVLKYSRNQNHV